MDKVGKRMPYSVPDGFFEQLENNVLHEVQQQSLPEKGETARHTRRLTVWIRSIAAVAATIALVWLGGTQLHERQQDSINEVEQAFAGLSTDDQAYMLSVYQDDLFMND